MVILDGGRPAVRKAADAGLLGLPVALGAAVLTIVPLVQRVHIAEYDEAVLLDAAHNVQRLGLPIRSLGYNGTPLLDHTPLYPYLLSLFAPPAGHSLLLARLVTVLAALACIVLTYQIGVAVRGRAAGFLAAMFVAVNSFFAVYSFFIRMEVFMVLSVLLALVLLLRRRPPSTGALLGAGIALAAGVLFKEFALLVVAPAGLYALLAWRRQHRSGILAAAYVAAPPILALGAWVLWVRALWPDAIAGAMNRWFRSAAGGQMLDPRMLTSSPAWSSQIISDLLGPGLALALAVALIAACVRVAKGVRSEDGLLWLYLVVALAASYAFRLREPRHLIALVPVAGVLAGAGLVSLFDTVRTAKSGTWALLLVISLLLLLASPVRPFSRSIRAEPKRWIAPLYEARLNQDDSLYGLLAGTGREMQRLTASGEMITVAHQGPVIAYYADRPYLMLYTLGEERILQALAETRLLVWDAPTWLVLPPERVPTIEARVAEYFEPLLRVSEGSRTIVIHQRKP